MAVTLGDPRDGETVRLLQGARLITDWESRLDGELPDGLRATRKARDENRLVARLEQLSRDYGLASRVMALVAVVGRVGDDASCLPTTRVVPVGMPEDTCFESYFGAVQPSAFHALDLAQVGLAEKTFHPLMQRFESPRRKYLASGPRSDSAAWEGVLCEALGTEDDRLMEAVARLLPDGGLPGASEQERLLRSAALLLALLGAGSTARVGPYRLHVQKLIRFLKDAAASAPSNTARQLLEDLVACAETGPAGAPQPREWIEALVCWSPKPGAGAWARLKQ